MYHRQKILIRSWFFLLVHHCKKKNNNNVGTTLDNFETMIPGDQVQRPPSLRAGSFATSKACKRAPLACRVRRKLGSWAEKNASNYFSVAGNRSALVNVPTALVTFDSRGHRVTELIFASVSRLLQRPARAESVRRPRLRFSGLLSIPSAIAVWFERVWSATVIRKF